MMNDSMSIKRNSMTQRKFWMNFISYIQANCAKYRSNYQQKWANECYERIKINKTEQDWSSNQFAMHASEYSA